MVSKNWNLWLITYVVRSKKDQNRGFSLAELLVASVIGSIVTIGVLWLSNQLLQADKTEKDKSRGQENVAQAMDYIVTELKDAEYIYDGDCIGDGNTTKKCPGLSKVLSFGQDIPVLAFWKSTDLTDNKMPTDCDAFGVRKKECSDILIGLRSYALVVYSLRKSTTAPWQGPAQIVRYELPQYDIKQIETLTVKPGYPTWTKPESLGSPITPNSADVLFTSWPCEKSNAACGITAPYGTQELPATVLADLVDDPGEAPVAEECPKDVDDKNQLIYSPVPKKDNTNPSANSFYACVRIPGEIKESLGQTSSATTSSSSSSPDGKVNTQDVILFLRLNLTKQAGQEKDKMAYRPSVKRQIATRNVLRDN